MWLGAQQYPAQAGGSWAVSLTAEMGALMHMQWDSMHSDMARRDPQDCLLLKVPGQPPTRHASSSVQIGLREAGTSPGETSSRAL